MAAKSTKSIISSLYRKKNKKKLGRHKKSETSNKGSKNYHKKYRGQGRSR